MIELIGKIPKRLTMNGKYSKDYFNRKGELKAIKTLKFWPLKDVLKDKYKWSTEDAEGMASFIEPMLNFLPGYISSLILAYYYRK